MRWPRGQHILQPSEEALRQALATDPWVDLKLRAGRWYLSVVATFARELGGDQLERYAGVEMAMDGCMSNLSGAIDAALFRLVRAFEALHEQARVPDRAADIRRARKLVAVGGSADSLDRLEEATGREQGEPTGWLSQLRDARNRSTHQASLSRHYTRGGGPGTVLVVVPGVPQPVEPLAWLSACLREAVDLAGGLLSDAERTGHVPPR